VIDAVGLTFGYQPRMPVIQGWTASIGAGEIVAITGPSGCGKSTLLYVLGTLVHPWSGQLHLAGQPVQKLGDGGRSRLRAALIGFVFQDALLDPRRSVQDNVVEGAVYRGASRRDALPRAQALLESLGVTVEPRRLARDLSGGQAQRVALCRALLGNPRIVLADEPTGNLDEANAAAVEAVLVAHARTGGTVVVATHDLAFASRCDRIVRL
jgi:ABC-type lipoprotein export system ATPase subunit